MLRRHRKMLNRLPDGRYELRLAASYREFLAGLADQMTSMLTQQPDDPTLRRLSPPAYLEDEDVAREAEFQIFMAGQLRDSRLEALAVLRETAERTELTEEEVIRWMQALNSIRLVVGTRLNITDDEEDPVLAEDDPELALWDMYDLLSLLLERTVASLGPITPLAGGDASE